MELIKNVSGWGNSAGVLLPKEWKGKEVKIILIDRSSEIKKEVFDMLSDYLEDILGIYLTGSYARGEQEVGSDTDIIAISNKTKKEIVSGKYHVSIATLNGIKNTIKAHPELILPRLNEAKTILNESLLEELKKNKLGKKSFKNFVEDTKRVIRINKGFLELDKEKSEYVISKRTVYSAVLRLRGFLLIKSLLEKKKYSKKLFEKLLLETLNEDEFERVYSVYKSIRDDEKTKEKVRIETVEKLLEFLKKQLEYFK